MVNNARILEVNVGDVFSSVFSPMANAKGVPRAAQSRIARVMRQELRAVLTDTIIGAYRDGSAPMRTGRGRAAMLNGVRSFGTTLAGLRGHIIGPAYIKAHEEGATIRPKNSSALTIPLAAAQRPDGSPKLPGPRSWRNVQKTFIYKSARTGNSYIAYKGGSGLVLLYVLVDEITLSKYKGFLSRSFDLRKPALAEALGRAMLLEMGQVDLLGLARITYRGRR